MKSLLASAAAIAVLIQPAAPAMAQAQTAAAGWGVATDNLSSTIRPGDDFYRYVNEGWLRSW